MEAPIDEADIPRTYDLSLDADKIPQRNLTDFTVRRGGKLVSICSLDDAKDSSPFVAEGRLILGSVAYSNDGGIKERGVRVRIGRLVEWCIEYHLQPALWVRSSRAWYRLGAPAKEYKETHELARKRYELCARIFILGTWTPLDRSQDNYQGYVKLLSAPWEGMRGYSEKEILGEKPLILEQVKNLDDNRLNTNHFILHLKGTTANSGRSSKKKKGSSGSGEKGKGKEKKPIVPWTPKFDLGEEGNRKMMRRVDRILSNMIKHKASWPFLQPVDPVRDGCPTYFEIVDKPMDLGTIKSNLGKGVYKYPEQVARDVRQIWKNCRKFNADTHIFTQFTSTLERKFEDQMKTAESAEFTAINKKQSALSAKRQAPEKSSASGSAHGGRPDKKPKLSVSVKLPPRHPGIDKVEPLPPPDFSSTLPDLFPTPIQTNPLLTGPGRICLNEADCKGNGNAHARDKSKYCSEDCGLKVARRRMEEIKLAGIDVGEYLRQRMNKGLVLARMD